MPLGRSGRNSDRRGSAGGDWVSASGDDIDGVGERRARLPTTELYGRHGFLWTGMVRDTGFEPATYTSRTNEAMGVTLGVTDPDGIRLRAKIGRISS